MSFKQNIIHKLNNKLEMFLLSLALSIPSCTSAHVRLRVCVRACVRHGHIMSVCRCLNVSCRSGNTLYKVAQPHTHAEGAVPLAQYCLFVGTFFRRHTSLCKLTAWLNTAGKSSLDCGSVFQTDWLATTAKKKKTSYWGFHCAKIRFSSKWKKYLLWSIHKIYLFQHPWITSKSLWLFWPPWASPWCFYTLCVVFL